ncbi:MAG: 2-dehydropantoate 2-reductase [Bdellovibrionota bacterium]
MRLMYAIIGMGPVGSTIAVHLAQAGHDLAILCGYEAKYTALASGPLVVKGKLSAHAKFGNLHMQMESFLETKPDVIFIATKSCDSPAILQTIKQSAKFDKKTVFVSCQNGLGVEEQIINVFGSQNALRMVMNLGCSLIGENEVNVTFIFPQILSLRIDVNMALTRQVAMDLTSAGFKTDLKEDYQPDIFRKAILNSSLSSVCALTGMTMKAVLDRPFLKRIVEEIVREGISIAKVRKIAIGAGFFNEAMSYLSSGGDHKPSMLVDIENRRRTENDYHCGKLVQYAENSGMRVPVTETVYGFLKSIEDDFTRTI